MDEQLFNTNSDNRGRYLNLEKESLWSLFFRLVLIAISQVHPEVYNSSRKSINYQMPIIVNLDVMMAKTQMSLT
jgi:flagellar assembly factor FliW